MDADQHIAAARSRQSRDELMTEDAMRAAELKRLAEERLQTSRPDPEELANQRECSELAAFWRNVSEAMRQVHPPADKMVISAQGMKKIRHAEGSGYPGNFRHDLAKTHLSPKLARSNAIPAWDTMADFSRIEPVSPENGDRYDMFNPDRMYLNNEGAIICRMLEKGNSGIFFGIFRITPGDVLKDDKPIVSPLPPTEQLHKYSAISRYEEIAAGLANLVVRFELAV